MTEQVPIKPDKGKEEYRKIIMTSVKEVADKQKNPEQEKYWTWVVSQLMEDLKDFETEGSTPWRKEPPDYEALQKKYGQAQVREVPAPDEAFRMMNEMIKKFFKDFGMDVV